MLEMAVRRTEVSQKQAAETFNLAETHKTNPRSVWGYVQGLTGMRRQR